MRDRAQKMSDLDMGDTLFGGEDGGVKSVLIEAMEPKTLVRVSGVSAACAHLATGGVQEVLQRHLHQGPQVHRTLVSCHSLS